MNLAVGNDLALETAEVRVVAYEIIELIRVVAMGHLIVGYRRRQIFGFVYCNIDVRVWMRVTIDEDMPFDRQFDALAQRPLFFEFSAYNSGPRLNNQFRCVHMPPLSLFISNKLVVLLKPRFITGPQALPGHDILGIVEPFVL